MQQPSTFILPLNVYQDKAYTCLRRGYIILIASIIERYVDDIEDYTDMVVAIEKSCYEDSIAIADQELLTPSFDNSNFEHLYRTRIMRITKNLDYESEVEDDHLVLALINGLIEPSTISLLDNKDLSPSRNKELLDCLSTRLNQHITLKTSSMYRCHKCGHKETTIQSKQMRSLDEPATLIITCAFCHYKWFS